MFVVYKRQTRQNDDSSRIPTITRTWWVETAGTTSLQG